MWVRYNKEVKGDNSCKTRSNGLVT